MILISKSFRRTDPVRKSRDLKSFVFRTLVRIGKLYSNVTARQLAEKNFIFRRVSLVFLLSFSFFCFHLHAQEPEPVKRSSNKIILEGKIYFIHVVKPGQTLYSISRAYEVSEKDIAIENPGVYSGLQIGQVLKIPADVPEREVPEKTKIDTSRFLPHKLQEGESLYGLSRMYNVPVSEIEDANPDLDHQDLQIGQIILIPKLKSVFSEDDYFIHKVQKKETIYGLAKQYGVSGEDIIDNNPSLRWGGLKVGQAIRIPRTAIAAHEEFDHDSISQDEPVVEEPSDTLSMLLSENFRDSLRSFRGRPIHVAFLIPFNYREKADTLKVDIKDLTEEERKKRAEEEMLPNSINFLEFFEGSLLAIDSLKTEGIKMEVSYFDTRRSPTRVRSILESPFLKKADLIIGPFFSWNVEIVSEFSRKNRIPLISPFYAERKLTEYNPYLFQLNPSYQTEYAVAANYLAKHYDKNFLYIYGADSFELESIQYFKNRLIRSLEDYTHPENVVIKEIVYSNAAQADLSGDLSHALSKDKKNIIIIPETDEAFVSSVITQLYFQLRNFDIEVFGLSHWSAFENIDYLYYHKLKLKYLTPYYYDYKDSYIENFISEFEQNFETEPVIKTRKGCPYAFIGYDITSYFIESIYRFDRDFMARINDTPVDQLLPEFDFKRNSNYGGFENKSLKLVEYHNDFSYEVRDAQLPDEKPEIIRPWPFRILNLDD